MGSDSAGRDALDGPFVGCGKNGGREMSFSQPLQKVDKLLEYCLAKI